VVNHIKNNTSRNGKCEESKDFAYADLCTENQAKRQARDDVVMIHWTDPMLEVFHSKARERPLFVCAHCFNVYT
jgi:hypothetical protein